MGIPLEIFSLYRLHSEDNPCQHYLLLRVEQPEFRNAVQTEYDAAVEVAEQKRQTLLNLYQAEVLANQCAGSHAIDLVGELQASAIGDELSEGPGGGYVDVWVAATRFGHPWVVLGTAENEAAFWCEVEQDEDLAYLGAVRPATQQRAFFLTESLNLGQPGWN